MKYVGIDLHKKTISGCVVVKERGQKEIAARQRLEWRDEAGIKSWFSEKEQRTRKETVGQTTSKGCDRGLKQPRSVLVIRCCGTEN